VHKGERAPHVAVARTHLHRAVDEDRGARLRAPIGSCVNRAAAATSPDAVAAAHPRWHEQSPAGDTAAQVAP
jgi:hypothetical protein